MASEPDIRLRADRLFVEHLCALTGKTASALAAGAGMAATTLNRYASAKVKPTSTLKDSTIQKIAKHWGLDPIDLAINRRNIEDGLRDGKSATDIVHMLGKGGRTSSTAKGRGFKEDDTDMFKVQEPDPLMDRIMGATYEVWFHSSWRDAVAFENLPSIVRLLYSRARTEAKAPVIAEIKKRATDMLAVMAMEGKKRK